MRRHPAPLGKILKLGYDTSAGKILDKVTRPIDFGFNPCYSVPVVRTDVLEVIGEWCVFTNHITALQERLPKPMGMPLLAPQRREMPLTGLQTNDIREPILNNRLM